MRYTIRGFDNDRARASVRTDYLTRGERWRILLRGDRLRGIGRNTERPAPVHRERVRFGAWEPRPEGRASLLSRRNLMAHLVRAYACTHGIAVEPWQVQERLWRMGANIPRRNSAGTMARILATEMSGAQAGTGEGPQIPGPQNAYKCAECGDRECGGYECEVVDR